MVEKANYNYLPASFYNRETKELKVDKELADAVAAGIQARLDKLPPAEDEIFLSLTANLTPGDVDTPEKLDAVLDSFEAAAHQLNSPDSPVVAFVGDIAKFLARAMIEFAGEQRQNALNDRLAAREAAKAELLSQAGNMEDAADKIMTGAVTSLVMGVVGGAASMAGSIVSAAGSGFQARRMGAAATALQNADPDSQAAKTASTTFEVASTKAQSFNTGGQAVNAIGDAGRSSGTGVDGMMQSEAKREDAEGAKDAAQSQFFQQTSDMKKELQDSYNDMIKQIINFLHELNEAEVDAMRALTKV